MIRATAGQTIGAQMILATTGAAFTGAVTCYVTGDAGTQAIGSVSAGVCTHEGNGYHTYRPATAETDYALIAFTFIGTGALPQTIQIQTFTAATYAAASAAATGTVTGLDVVTDALREIAVVDPIDPIPPEHAAFALGKLNRLLDNWNADGSAVYGETFTTFTLTPSLNPHTIGPTGTWVTTQRPVRLDDGDLSLALSGSPVSYSRIVVMDEQAYTGLSMPALTSASPTRAYYVPAWPNGQLYLYPVPSSAASVRVRVRGVLGALTLVSTFTMPPGYRDAVTLTLAESLGPAFGAPVSPDTKDAAQRARGRAFANNDRPRRLRTMDAGMPGGYGSGFDFRTGLVS